MKQLMKRIRAIEEKVGNLSDADSPHIVFIDQCGDGYRVIEDYFKKNTKGQIVQGGKRKTYTTKKTIDEIVGNCDDDAVVYIGELELED